MSIISPYGGELVSLMVPAGEHDSLAHHAAELPSLVLNAESCNDLELLATGSFSPLRRFTGAEDFRSVVERGRLADGTFFPMPVCLPVPNPGDLAIGQEVALRNTKNNLLAWMRIDEIFDHCYVSGELRVLELPGHYDFPELRRTPAEIRKQLSAIGNLRVLAFQTMRPIHRTEEEMTKRAAADLNATLLIELLGGKARPGDIDFYSRVRASKAAIARHFDARSSVSHMIPLTPRGNPALQALVARNYGASHLLVHEEFPEPEGLEELGLQRISAEGLACRVTPAVREEIAEILAAAGPPRHRQGFCIWLTGLPSAGKSTIAEVLAALLAEHGRQVTLLDGDVVRTHLSRGLGFSREDRDTNILRIGFVASEIVRHQGAVICAAVSPYRSTRGRVREMMPAGQFVEVFVDTPLTVCEQRDVKGYYARARAGQLKGFTGVDDPYEAPPKAEVTVDTVSRTPMGNARAVFEYLQAEGFFGR